jgi:tRNA threonylcarbamoyladenosine biosynthesis protein TsaB
MRATRAAEGQHVLAAIDARMGEVYLGAFVRDGDGMRAMSDEVVVKPALAVIPEGDGWHGVGTGFAAADGALPARLDGRLAAIDAGALPHAADVARLGAQLFARGEAIAPERIEPAYLRNNVALTIAEQQALLSGIRATRV